MRSACSSPFSPFQSKFCSLASRGVGGAVRSPGLWSPVLEKSGEGSLPRTSFGDLSPTQKWMGRASELRVGALSLLVPLPAPGTWCRS